VYPAARKACLKYGASKSTHRVDDVVSGRTTPTCRLVAPLVPAVASALSWLMVDAMLTVNELMLRLGTVADDDEVAEDVADDEPDEDAEDEQPAATIARAAARATQPILGRRRDVPWPCLREYRPPSLLLLTIPDTLSPGCTRISRPGHR
jgi:hypothetical protein